MTVTSSCTKNVVHEEFLVDLEARPVVRGLEFRIPWGGAAGLVIGGKSYALLLGDLGGGGVVERAHLVWDAAVPLGHVEADVDACGVEVAVVGDAGALSV